MVLSISGLLRLHLAHDDNGCAVHFKLISVCTVKGTAGEQSRFYVSMKCVVAAVVLGGYAAAFAHPQAVSSTTQIQAGAYTGQPPLNPALGIRTVDLWPDGAPGVAGDGCLRHVCPERVCGAAGTPQRDRRHYRARRRLSRSFRGCGGPRCRGLFAAHGITAFVLRYRLGAKYLYPVPLDDAMRAMWLVRAYAADKASIRTVSA